MGGGAGRWCVVCGCVWCVVCGGVWYVVVCGGEDLKYFHIAKVVIPPDLDMSGCFRVKKWGLAVLEEEGRYPLAQSYRYRQAA